LSVLGIIKPMLEIRTISPEEGLAARRVIYTVAHEMFHDFETLEETIAGYATEWPLHDMEDIQKHYFDNGGTFLVLLDEGKIVGTGALNRLEDGVGEIKRLWLLADYQGKGWGYRLMQQLLEEARRQGYKKLRLETSPEYQQRAYMFYKKLGFYDIPRYGSEFDDIGMELILQ